MIVFIAFLFYLLIFALLIALLIFAIFFITSPYSCSRVETEGILNTNNNIKTNTEDGSNEEKTVISVNTKKTIKKTSGLPLQLKTDIQSEQVQLLTHFSNCLKEADIPFWATKTTLFAAVKYGKLMPWEDKISVAILHGDLSKLSSIRSQLETTNQKFKLTSGKHGWTFHKNNVTQFPNIEITIMSIKTHEISVCTPTTELGECSYQDSFLRRKEVFPSNYVFPLTSVPLGSLFISIPIKATDCLTMLYGPKWETDSLWSNKKIFINENARGLVKKLKLTS